MLFVENTSLDPYFNIAAEEYLLKHFDTEIVMIWRSKPSIIVGKHQNTLGEINLEYVRKSNIPVVRRLSGGGTVFHDPGNINFTFIRKADKEKLVDFRYHTQPIVDFLQSIHVDAVLAGKNDIRVNGLKISGNAEHVYRNKVLHHGTLLFDADIEDLNLAIKAKESHFESKAVKSIRSRVTNISAFTGPELQRDDFMMQLIHYLKKHFDISSSYHFNPSDLRAIGKIKTEKYVSWEWNYGYSPTYAFRNSKMIDNTTLTLELTVARGKISDLSLWLNDLLQPDPILNAALKDTPHRPDAIEGVLREINFREINKLKDPWILVGLFF